ncbi:ferredoxin [Arcanobacterium pluranimalium]|uniref:4Fe-4S dicluster domain-containing protein n=1 Tax=Arcanobacterium pluranimalium TaxID=108028 RepID=UPI001956E2EF|nr:4Fe-4S dicluster domain-containing protein [Arcanobacterium pluranimalium]MBM7825568.1 ferredoxin [Arcanobacterium pluranimalium]
MSDSDLVRPLLRWLFAHDLPQTVILTCAHSHLARSPRTVQIVQWNECIASAPLGLPAQLLALGIQHVSVEQCEHATAGSAEKIQQWMGLTPGMVSPFQGFGRFMRRGEQVLRCGKIPLPRRVLLGLSVAEKTPYSFVGDDVDRTVRSIELLREQGRLSSQSTLSASLGGHRLGITTCTGCGVCARACPNGALEIVQLDTASTVIQHRDLCRGDERCVSLCPEQGIWVEGEVDLRDLLEDNSVELFQVATSACEKCGARHPLHEGNLCKICQFKARSPFGSVTLGHN